MQEKDFTAHEGGEESDWRGLGSWLDLQNFRKK